jgi:hypothetical protein
MKRDVPKCMINHSSTQTGLCVNISDTSIDADGSFEMHHTHHSLARIKKRGIREEHLANLFGFGSCYEKQGLQYYVLSNKEVNCENLNIKLNDTLVAVVKDNIIITSYYTNKISGHRYINKKSKQYIKTGGLYNKGFEKN